MGKCFKCGRSAGFLLNKCEGCVQLEERAEAEHAAADAPAIAPADARQPGGVACPFCRGDVVSAARKCCHCGEWLDQTADPTRAANAGALVMLGGLLMVVGAVGMLFGFNMSATVHGLGETAFNNIGLLNDKQNVILASGFVSVAGAVLFAAGYLRGSR
jgi:hypothetical protein